MTNPLDCDGNPLPWSDRRCAPGIYDYPTCYRTEPGGPVLRGYKRITVLEDCTSSGSELLDADKNPAPVGSEEVGCSSDGGGGGDGCDCPTLCEELAALPVVAPVDDAAAFLPFVEAGVCSRASITTILAGAGITFPGYGANIQDVGAANAPGVSVLVAREDHVHEGVHSVNGLLGDVLVTPSLIGANQTLTVQDAGAPQVVGPSALDFNDGFIVVPLGPTAQINLDYAVSVSSADASPAVVGTSTRVAREDHKHLVLTDVPVAIGITNAAGVSTALSRADHVHRGAVPFSANGALIATQPGINIIAGSGVTVVAANDAPNNRVNYTISVAASGSALLTFGANNINNAADTRVLPPGWIDGLANTNSPRGFRAPRAGTLRNLTARHNIAAGNGASVQYFMRVNGVATLLSVTLATGAIGSVVDAVNTVAVAAGDLVECVCTKAASIGTGVLDALCAVEFA